MILLDGKKAASTLEQSLKEKIAAIGDRKPGLAFIRVGNNPASKVYIGMKKKKCAEVGIHSVDHELPENTSASALLDLIDRLNASATIDGILLQLPLPAHLSPSMFLERIDPRKDVDGFHPYNMGRLLMGHLDGLIACTPKGIHHLLQAYQIPIAGKHVVIVGRSNIVGKPLAALLLQKDPSCNATVTVAHSQSENLTHVCKEADILIAAVGIPNFIQSSMIKTGATVIDVGINKVGATLVGDVDFPSVAPLCSHITPVPGGVGPMTIALLMENTFLAYTRNSC